MSNTTIIYLSTPVLFIGMLALLEIGRRVGLRYMHGESERERSGYGLVQAANFGLLGLLIAFTVSGAANRYDARRTFAVQEANAIGTVYLRLDFLPAAAQAPLQHKLRRYTAERLAVFRTLSDHSSSSAHESRALELQREIWAGVMAELKDAPAPATVLLVTALNEMFDITNRRKIATLSHTPPVVLGVLALLAVFCCLLAGYSLAGGQRLASTTLKVGFALVVTLTIYVIMDLDYPRAGLIRLDYTDQIFNDLMATMKVIAP